MRIPRLYVTQKSVFSPGQCLILAPKSAHYIGSVLRLGLHDRLIIFNSESGDYVAEIIQKERDVMTLKIIEQTAVVNKPMIDIHLVQSVCRREKLEWVLQKATELGVTAVRLLETEHSFSVLPPRYHQKINAQLNHFNHVLISSSEQCGRNVIPVLYPIMSMKAVLAALREDNAIGLLLSPGAEVTFQTILREGSHSNPTGSFCYYLFIGPEGGFTPAEIALAQSNGVQGVRLGPRVLRTESAGLAAICALQTIRGDFT